MSCWQTPRVLRFARFSLAPFLLVFSIRQLTAVVTPATERPPKDAPSSTRYQLQPAMEACPAAHHIWPKEPIPSVALVFQPIIRVFIYCPLESRWKGCVRPPGPVSGPGADAASRNPSPASGPQGGVQPQMRSKRLELHGVFAKPGLRPPECWRPPTPCVPIRTLPRSVGSVRRGRRSDPCHRFPV
jgi:hypothetical protein